MECSLRVVCGKIGAVQNGKKGPIVDPTKLHWAPLRIMTKKRDKWRIQAKLKNPEHDS